MQSGTSTLVPRMEQNPSLLGITNNRPPICTLPPEVLSRIFQLGQSTDTEERVIDDEDSSEPLSAYPPFELLVSHVSLHFRNVALGTHRLWDRITTGRGLANGELKTYLERSNGCLLGVRIDLLRMHIPDPLAMAKVDMITLHTSRYQRLAINSVCETQSHPVLRRFCDLSTPRLRHLSVSVDEVENITAADAEILKRDIPGLLFVRMGGLALHFFRPPLHNVETLHLDQTVALPMLFDTFRIIVTTPSRLRNLSIYGEMLEPQTNWTSIGTAPISLPHLQSLRICGISGAIYSGILLGISAPALETLTLKDLKERDLVPFLSLEAPIRDAASTKARFPVLSSLTLLDPEVSSDVYIELFRVFPGITSFVLACQTSAPTVLQLLSGPLLTGPNTPWLRLQTLALLVNIEVVEGLTVKVARERKKAGCPLTKLRLGIAGPLSELLQYAWLKENVELETFVEVDQWPMADSAYDVDPDDTLFA